ncbi:RNA polymerase factor sigma-54 [Desulfosporosinus nitroreducens]|uniref:RNA polymerase factor sigma-54 n=1 Tax=Desulfosporosinus nitroreducens TaxID=2018668 RepID=A0ABT8QL48_9FIRM|nr:RNA polymerase factor sigma-54 [Desulfosporosinus nitroreducens]MCO1601572.1 RNA polymerase factor sigma-54 [Desulfosporosinus nitroreducens]MDO0822067.1 RNA polymerase factor sigma-54 [Desulfosporosinus nitroreducens]
MRLGYGLSLEQTQKLIMTPELRQAITILQLSALDLSTYVEEQLLENPLLENLEESTDSKVEAEPPVVEESPPIDKWEVDWQDYFHDQDENRVRQERVITEDKQRFDPFIAAAPTLQEHLLEQLHVQRVTCSLDIAEYIIGNLNDKGYLTLSLDDIVREMNVSLAEVEDALTAVQSLDPLGVGARNLEECLSLQLPLLINCPPELPEFLKHLEDLAAGRLQRIAHALKVSLSRVQELADSIRKLDPKPGLRFSGPGEVRYIVPDVVIEEIEGQFIILVNDITVPRLGVNKAYRDALSQDEGTDTRKFVEQKLNAAAWLIRSIEQRRLTLYKVADAIVKWQNEFLRSGIRHLKPLTLRDIAEEIGVHESTVSRATAHKYVQTPRGIFEFKFFFANSMGRGTQNDSGVTTDVIKLVLRDIIASENPKCPYSDQKLADLLKARDMEISRRTVAKYRDELGIAATTVRKRY